MSDTDPNQVQIVSADRIVTMVGDEPEAIAFRGDWIIGTGGVRDLRSRHPTAKVRSFPGATIVPGFNDAHQHPTICAEQSLQVDLAPHRVADTAAVVSSLRARAAETPAGEWIVGFGYDPFRSNGGADLTRWEVDDACPDHPVLIVHVTLHTGVLNSRGLALAGFETPEDAPSGGALGTEASMLNGVVHDQALYDTAFPAFTRKQTVVPMPGRAELREAFLWYTGRLLAAGITSVGDALVGPGGWEIMQELDGKGTLPVRVNALAAYDHFDWFRDLGQGAVDPDARLRLGGIKAFADGAVNGGSCLVDEPVIGGSGHGLERVSPAEMVEIVRDVHDAGWRVAVHANGDRAIRYVLDAVELAQEAKPEPDPRHRLEHTSIVTPAILARMKDLRVVTAPFSAYPLAHGDKLARWYGPERIEWMFAHRSMLDYGIPVAASSDHPCGPFEPLFGMRSLVERRDRAGADFGRSQRISAEEALGMYTTGSAWASMEEATKGRLAEGYLADFVILGGDPLTAAPEQLADIPVLETWVGGEPVWIASA